MFRSFLEREIFVYPSLGDLVPDGTSEGIPVVSELKALVVVEDCAEVVG